MPKKFVYSLNYWLKTPGGEVIDTSEGGVPMVFVEGSNNVIQGIQDAVRDRHIGDILDVTIPAELAYGRPKPELISVVPMSMFDGVDEVKVGMKFQTNTGTDAKVVQVVEVNSQGVKIDANHPLAGFALNFELEVVQKREATDEEVQRNEVLSS